MATSSWILILVAILQFVLRTACQTKSFVIDKEQKCFLKDGQFFRYISGSIDYFRVPRAYWKDRLHKMRMAGLNTIAPYVEWSGHEPHPGKYNFADNYDLVEFCKEAQREDLLVILRVGPYICDERDNGGLPSWLYGGKPSPAKVRTTDQNFIGATEKWLGQLLPMIKALFYKNGGPIIALQVENEYGLLLCESGYIPKVYNIFKQYTEDDVILFTSDYWREKDHKCGGIKDIPKAVNMYPSDSVESVQSAMNSINSQGCPLFVMELYVGWFDLWGKERSGKNAPQFMNAFKELMRRNASVNIYMFHGGTNFGFGSPSGSHGPLLTSYDYNAPLSEEGDPRPLYSDIRDAIKEFSPLPTGDVPVASPKFNIGAVKLNGGSSLLEVMDYFRENRWLKTETKSEPMTFEEMGQDYGFVMYTARVGSLSDTSLTVNGIKDRAYVVTKASRAVLDSKRNTASIKIEEGENLTIIAENVGRTFTKIGEDPKGITGTVKLGSTKVKGWTMEAVPVVEKKDVSLVMQFLENKTTPAVPGFFCGTFTLPPGQGQVGDTFLDTTGWTKGVAFINGINLGRYWPKKGPQVTLYLPGAFMLPHPKENRLFLLEMEGAPEDRTVKLTDTHILNGTLGH